MLVCDKCNSGIIEGAKFCPQCGDPVTEADRVEVPTTQENIANVEISFGQSSSVNFNRALGICKNIPSYSVQGEGKEALHRVSLPITEVELIINLYELVGSWKSSKMLINGHLATKKDLTYYGVGCFRNRQKAYQPKQYCFGERNYEVNIWGCKRLDMPIYEFGGGWLDYGSFDKSGVWHFDKEKIRHELELEIKENELCPALSRKRVLETLDNLPETIDPKTDDNWQYRTEYKSINGMHKEVAVGIKPNIKNISSYVIGEYEPTWVEDPDGFGVGQVGRIKIDLELNDNEDKDIEEMRAHERDVSGAWILIIIVVIAILFLLFS